MKIQFFLIFVLLSSVVEGTNGSDFVSHGTKQSGLAGAGAAEAQDSTWMTLNPATITELPNMFDFHYEYFSPRRVVDMQGFGTNPNRDVDTDESLIPNLSLTYRLSESEVLGVGLFTYAGANTHLSQPRSFAGTFGNYDKSVDYWTMKLNVVYAKKFKNGWSIGFGPSLIFSRLRTDMATLIGSETQGGKEWDDSWGGGFSFGVHKRWDKWAWGLGYSSKQWTERFDKYEDLFSAIEHPQFVQTGISYKLTDSLTWLVDYRWIDWNGVNIFKKSGSDGGFGWSDQHILKTGLSWDVTEDTTLRAGYSYGRSAMNADGVFANALFPTPIEHHVTFGASHMITDTLELTLSYIHGFTKSFTESNKDFPAPVASGSKVSLDVDLFGIGISWYF